MPIGVRCNCGQAFKARDDLAGNTVKCPMCRGPLTIPKPPPPTTIPVACSCGKGFRAQEQLAGRTVKCPSCGGPLAIPDPAVLSNSLADLLDEAEEELAAKQQREQERLAELRNTTCIECGAQIHPHSSLCRSCGYSYELGRKIQPQAEANWERWARETNMENAVQYQQEYNFQTNLGVQPECYHTEWSLRENLHAASQEYRRVQQEQKAMNRWLRYI